MAAFAVVALAVVLHHQLPVALLDQVDLRGDLGPVQLVGREVGATPSATPVEVRRRLVGEADEDQSGDDADVHPLQAEALLVEAGRLVAGVQQRAVGGVGPLVVAAHDVADRARLDQHARAPMPADIVQRPHHLVVVAEDDDRVRADVDGDVVARVRDLAF